MPRSGASDGTRRRVGFSARRVSWLETAAVLGISAVATVYAEWDLLFHSMTVQTDAMVHEWWMRRFQYPGLFNDPLTHAFLRAGYEPSGVRGLYWLGSHLVDPVRMGAWLPVVLAPLSTWLVFRIVREHTEWRPAAWLGASLFLFALDGQSFSGGHPRAFGAPIVLGTSCSCSNAGTSAQEHSPDAAFCSIRPPLWFPWA